MHHKKYSRHSPEVIKKILSLFDIEHLRVQDIHNQSKKRFGYKIQRSTISSILKRYGRNTKTNTYLEKKP